MLATTLTPMYLKKQQKKFKIWIEQEATTGLQ